MASTENNFEYNNRDLSWLMFNYRVLQEAADSKLPIYERIKFLAIYSNNLDEFYRVRVSYYRSLIRNQNSSSKAQTLNAEDILLKINQRVAILQEEFHKIYTSSIIPELENEGIRIIPRNANLTQEQSSFIENIFQTEILPYLQPVILVKQKVKPFLCTDQIYLVIKLLNKDVDLQNERPRYGLIKLDSDNRIPRFVEIPKDDNGNFCIMFLEDVAMRHIHELYPGYKIGNWYSIKLTRDADLEYDEQEGEELINTISNIATTRQLGLPNRFSYDREMPEQMLHYLMDTFGLTDADIVKADDYHNLCDLFSLPNPCSPRLEIPVDNSITMTDLDSQKSLIDYIEHNEILLHFPYQSYDYFLNYLTEASRDKSVIEIKATQYRVANNSAVVNALIKAANRGKKVTVFVELKARFDEENNLQTAREMKRAGINIIYSMSGLKVHAKVAMVIRRNADGSTQSTCFLGTGNFNEETARLYCDHGFFTANPEINADVSLLFDILEQQILKNEPRHILIPNVNMVERFSELITNEIQNAKAGRKAHILLKMNGLEDQKMIDHLYEASLAGVKIDLIVRGACCLKTNQPYSRNIRAIRIVDCFLEHARVYKFHNNGNPIIYLGSADLMHRNLYRRIECVFPIYNQQLKQEIIDILNIQLSDTQKAVLIGENGENIPFDKKENAIRAQHEIYEYLKNKYARNNNRTD